MSHQPISEYFTEAELEILYTIHEKHYAFDKKTVAVLLDDYAQATGVFKDAKDPMALLFIKLTELAIKNTFEKPVFNSEYSQHPSSYEIIHDEAFNLMLLKIDEHHFPIEQYPNLVISAAIRHISVLEKMLKYDFDLEQKIYNENTRSVLDVAHECKFDNKVYPRLRSHQRKISLLKLGILDKAYLAYLMSINEYCIVIENYISPEFSIAQQSSESLIISLLKTSLKRHKDHQEESEKIFTELVDKIGNKINLGEHVDVLYEALNSKNTHAVQKLLGNYQFDFAKATYVTNYESCWNAASSSDNSACLDLVKAYLKKRRLEVSQSFGIDLTDPKLAAFQKDIEAYLCARPESDENKRSNLNVSLLFGSLYLTSIRKQDLDTLEYLYTHMTHDKFKGFDYIFTNLDSKFTGILVKRLHQSAKMDINSPELLSHLFSLYRQNLNLDAFKYLKECGVDLNKTISVGTYLKRETTIAKELALEKQNHTELFALLENQPTQTQKNNADQEPTSPKPTEELFFPDPNLFGDQKQRSVDEEEEGAPNEKIKKYSFYDESDERQIPNIFQKTGDPNNKAGLEKSRDVEEDKKTYGAQDLYPDRKHLIPAIKNQKWTAFGFKPTVNPIHMNAFLVRLDVKKAQLPLQGLPEKASNSYANLLTYGAKLQTDFIQDKKDIFSDASTSLDTKINALSEFINTILSQENLESNEAIENIRAAYLKLERQDQNRGTGFYKVHSFFTGKKFINAKGKNDYVKSTVGELAYDFMKAIDHPAKEEDHVSLDF